MQYQTKYKIHSQNKIHTIQKTISLESNDIVFSWLDIQQKSDIVYPSDSNNTQYTQYTDICLFLLCKRTF